MKNISHKSGFGTVELLLSIIIVILVGLIGWIAYRGVTARPAPSTESVQAAQQSSQPKVAIADPYAGWKTYTLAEDTTIKFKYPSDWTVLGDYKDTTSTPYNRFFKIVAPVRYHDNDVVFIFRYSPGKDNQFTQACSQNGGYSSVVASENLTVGGDKLKIVTNTGSLDATKMITMALVDDSSCYVVVPSGVIEATENLGSQSAPTYSIDLATWQSLPESKTINLIMKSVRF